MLNKFKYINVLLKNPIRVFSFFFLKFVSKKFARKKFFFHSSINKKVFLLSFDCDTQKDINALEQLLKKLKEINFKIVLAIPGELIKKNIELIKSLRDKYNIEFLNHGYYLHTYFDDVNQNYEPIFSYENKNIEFIQEDIRLAHELFKKYFKIDLVGFRAPHFGDINFNKKKKIFKYLKKLGYTFSSSSIYDIALYKGAVFKIEGITEISVTGCADKPVKVLDSWSYLINKKNELILSTDYYLEIKKLHQIILNKDYNFINIYADPSHVAFDELFFKELKNFSKFNLLNFRDIRN